MLKKKLVSVLLATAMVLGLGAPAFAAENEKAAAERAAAEEAEYLELLAMDEDNIPLEIMEKYYSLTEEEVEEILARNDDVDTAVSMSDYATAAINELAAQATETAGPFTKIYAMPARYFDIMVANMKSNLNKNIYPQSYNGKDCYLFSNGETNVYVEATAFYSLSENKTTYPSDTALSKTLTAYINKDNTTPLCNTHVNISVGDGIFYWDVSQISTEAFFYSDVDVTVSTKILSSISFSANSTFNYLTALSTKKPISYQPELAIEITDGGSNNAFFGGFEVVGKGDKASTLDISSLLNLGYNAFEIYSNTYTVKTFFDIFKDAFILDDDPASDSQITYSNPRVSLSNPDKDIWTRQCRLKSPYKLSLPLNTYQINVGIRQNSSTVKYAITVKFSF